MTTFFYGSERARYVLIQPVDDHDSAAAEDEFRAIRERTDADFSLIALKVDSWNDDLSPWRAPAVFGNEGFGDGAAGTLDNILRLCEAGRTYFIGGYSLAGLFALWAAYQTDRFAGAAAASPSVWFPGFTDYMRTHEILCGSVYLSLGDREEKTRNPVTSTVGSSIRSAYEILNGQGTGCVLEWNPGNHFRDTAVRTAKAFAWLLNHADGIRDSRG